MLGLFRKTSWKIDGTAFSFLQQVLMALPAEYLFLADGLNKGLYSNFSLKDKSRPNAFKVNFVPSQFEKFMKKGLQFELENILIKEDGFEHILNLTVYDGVLLSFEIDKSIIDFKDFKIDLSSFRRCKSKYAVDSNIENLVEGLSSEKLDLNDLSEFEVEGKTFYQIKDLEDGNYIAINSKGQVFGLIHDPFKIELISESLTAFVNDVNKGLFDFDEYGLR